MRLNLLLAVLLVLPGCGLKTNLMVYDDSAPMPQIANLSYQVHGDKLELALDIAGGSGTVLYQIDRAEVDPSCQCINNWLRFYESSASSQRSGLKRHVKLSYPDKIYAFRVRVVDSLGRKSGWSKVIKANAK